MWCTKVAEVAIHMPSLAAESCKKIPCVLGSKPLGQIGPDMLGSVAGETPAHLSRQVPGASRAKMPVQSGHDRLGSLTAPTPARL